MSITKEQILAEIRRIAVENEGTPPGSTAFRTATGIKPSAWRGKYWVNWSQALTEAGYAPNSWSEAIPEDHIMEQLADCTRELGHFPVDAELKMRKRSHSDFPSTRAIFGRYGTLQTAADALRRYAESLGDQELIAICERRVAQTDRTRKRVKVAADTFGSVYLMKSGAFYKIGLSNSSGRREYEIGIQLPEKLKLVHEIKTDCPAALEKYWYTRFADRRKNGEWFELSAADVKAFKKRKQFSFGESFD